MNNTTDMEVPSRRHPKYWFSDGSVILRIQGTHLRVHKSIVRSCSEVFDGMFKLPQPDEADCFDGCPMVELHDEKEDFEVFMEVLYNPLWFDDINESDIEQTLSFAASLLKMSNKYGCQSLRKKAISLTKKHVPTDFTAFNKINNLKGLSYGVTTSLLSLYRETNLRIFMPSIYFAWATKSPVDIMKNARIMDNNKRAPWEDIATCITGRDTLLDIQGRDVFRFFKRFPRPDSCVGNSSGKCAQLALTASEEHLKILRGDLEWTQEWKHARCENCVSYLKELYNEIVVAFWNKVPEAFGLGSWEALRDEAQDFV